MSLGLVKAGLGLAVLLVFLNEGMCAPSNNTGLLVPMEDSGKIDTTKFVAENRTFRRNSTLLEAEESREITIKQQHGTHNAQDTHKKRKQKEEKPQKGFMEKMLPMMVLPFLVSTSMIPMMLVGLKIMILKSAFLAKIGILLMLFNMFRRRTSGEGGIFSHNVNANDVAMEHYGYHGDEEYGAYVN